jgi:alkanesulfonate monooxygenase SsuD/methylene tetrahydromethanopterin reductase-like flavin-dependent oxidoreductase (luciferase family)
MFVGVTCAHEFWGLPTYRLVEELGFDGVFCGEHLLSHRPVWDAVSMTTAMACATERIAVGAAAAIAPLRHPSMLAKEFAGVDRISGGRAILALGTGGDNPRELPAAGVPNEGVGRRTNEVLDIVRLYWSGARFSWPGDLFPLDDVWLDPLPVRPGGPPLWVAGRKAPSVRRAALRGDGFLPYMYTPERCATAYAEVRALAHEARRVMMPDFAFGAYVYVSYGADHAAAVRRGDEHLAWRYAEPRYRTDLAGKYVVAGDAAAVAEGLLAYHAAGCTHLVLSLVRDENEPPEPELEAFATNVLPLLRAAGA